MPVPTTVNRSNLLFELESNTSVIALEAVLLNLSAFCGKQWTKISFIIICLFQGVRL